MVVRLGLGPLAPPRDSRLRRWVISTSVAISILVALSARAMYAPAWSTLPASINAHAVCVSTAGSVAKRSDAAVRKVTSRSIEPWARARRAAAR